MSAPRFILLTVFAFAIYFLAYQWVSHPLTDGEIVRLVAKKKSLLEQTPGERLVILAGSNGRFSHSCEVIEPIVGRPCVNASLLAGIGEDYVYSNFFPLLRPGDVVYMPYEYEQYALDKAHMFGGPDNAIMWRTQKKELMALGRDRFLRAAFFADEQYFIRGLLEMALNARGVTRRFDEASINRFGDQRGHTRAVGEPYVEYLRQQHVTIPTLNLQGKLPLSAALIGDFLDRARSRGITVIGGLPTTFRDAPIPPATIEQLRSFYEQHQQEFVALPDMSQYPRDCFFDKPYHLNEECQRAHSEILGQALHPLVKTGTSQ